MVADAHLEQEETSDDGEVAWLSIIDKSNQVNTIKVLEEAVVAAVTVAVTAEKPGGTGGTVGPGVTVGPGGTGVVPVGRVTRVYSIEGLKDLCMSYHSSVDPYGSGPGRRS